MRLRFQSQHDSEPAQKGFSVRRGWKLRVPEAKISPSSSFGALPPTPTTPRPFTTHMDTPESPSESELRAASSRKVSSASSSSDHHPVTPLSSPSMSPWMQSPSFPAPRPSTRLTFYEPSIGKLQPLTEEPLPTDIIAEGEPPRNVMRSLSKRVATMVRTRSWTMNRWDGGLPEPSRPPINPSWRTFGRGSSSVRDLRLEEREAPLRPARPSRDLGPQFEVYTGHRLNTVQSPIEEEEVSTPTTLASLPLTARAPASSIKSEAIPPRAMWASANSIKSEAIHPRIPPSGHYIKRSQSQYMEHKNNSEVWTEAMRLQVEYYNRPTTPPLSPRRGPAPPPRPTRRLPTTSADSVKSLPLESFPKSRFEAPSIKTISSATSNAETATVRLAEMVAASKTAPIAPPLKPIPDMPKSARSSCSIDADEPSESPEVTTPARAIADARFKVRRKAIPRSSAQPPRKSPLGHGIEMPSPSPLSSRTRTTKSTVPKRGGRRGTFGEDELANLAGAQEQLLARLYADSSDSCEPPSSDDESSALTSSESGPSGNRTRRPRPWGYL